MRATKENRFRMWLVEDEKWIEDFFLDGQGNYFIVDDFGNTLANPFRQKLLLSQYTNLKDKKGVKIYEGDIISNSRNNKYTWVIAWYNFRNVARCIQSPKLSQNLLQVSKWKNLEVIGNICENPELLEEK